MTSKGAKRQLDIMSFYQRKAAKFSTETRSIHSEIITVKPAAKAPSPVFNFDKQAWIDSLSPTEKELLQ